MLCASFPSWSAVAWQVGRLERGRVGVELRLQRRVEKRGLVQVSLELGLQVCDALGRGGVVCLAYILHLVEEVRGLAGAPGVLVEESLDGVGTILRVGVGLDDVGVGPAWVETVFVGSASSASGS